MLKNGDDAVRKPYWLWLWLWLLIAAVAAAALLYLLSWQFPGVLTDGEAQPYLAHHVILLVVLGSALMAGRHSSTGMVLRHAAIWIAIGAVAVLGYSYRSDFRGIGERIVGELRPDRALINGTGEVTIRRSGDGHFRLTATVDGKPIRFLVDTGASRVAISSTDAKTLGFDLAKLTYGVRTTTANGTAWVADISLGEIAAGTIRARNVRAAISRNGLPESLLGLTFLDRLSGYEVRGDIMILKP